MRFDQLGGGDDDLEGFVVACYEALNAFLADRPELLDEGAPLEFLLRLEIPGKRGAKGEKNDGNARVSAVDFPARRAWLQRALRDAPRGRRSWIGGSQREWRRRFVADMYCFRAECQLSAR